MVAPDFRRSRSAHPAQARFSNGDPVTPADVKSTASSGEPQGGVAAVPDGLADIERAEIVDARTVRIESASPHGGSVFVAGDIGVISRQWGAGKKFDEVVLEHADHDRPLRDRLGRLAGAHRVQAQSRLLGRHHPRSGRRGHFNFDRIRYRMYNDEAVAREAFKAGEFDLFKEYGAVLGATAPGAQMGDGRIVKASPCDRHRAGACSRFTSTSGGRSSRTSACAKR